MIKPRKTRMDIETPKVSQDIQMSQIGRVSAMPQTPISKIEADFSKLNLTANASQIQMLWQDSNENSKIMIDEQYLAESGRTLERADREREILLFPKAVRHSKPSAPPADSMRGVNFTYKKITRNIDNDYSSVTGDSKGTEESAVSPNQLNKSLLASKLRASSNKEVMMESWLGSIMKETYKIENVRRQNLVYGTTDLTGVLQKLKIQDELENPTIVQKKKLKTNKKPCHYYFLIDPNTRWIMIYDGYMTLINFWACVVSAWMTIFDLGDGAWVNIVDTIVLLSFMLDIIFTMCKQYRDVHGHLVTSHKLIFIRYFKSGWLVIDVLSTFPF
jgi:hypothetical protein